MRSILNAVLLVGFVCLSSIAYAQSGSGRQHILFPITVKTEWLALPATQPSGGGYAATTYSALKIQRAIDPKTNDPYDRGANPYRSDPKDMRRSFRLDKNNFLLGEPIVVEFRVELDGPGEWAEEVGGNQRARGRDDNFLFLLRRKVDSSWVADPYGGGDVRLGGLGAIRTVRKESPSNLFHSLQRWAVIESPGEYELYCIQFNRSSEITGRQAAMIDALPAEYKDVLRVSERGTLVDKTTGLSGERYLPSFQIAMLGEVESPLLEHVPDDVRARVGERLPEMSDFARFDIMIAEGSQPELARMVEVWTAEAEASEPQLTAAERIERARQGYGIFTEGRKTAVRESIWFARQDHFFPYIGRKISEGSEVDTRMLSGLAMNPSPAAFDLLFSAPPLQVVRSLDWIADVHIHRAIPRLIDWLTLEESAARIAAANRLREWTGQSLGQDWTGTRYDRPTLVEGRRMQPLWRDWWEKNKNTFKPN